MNINNSLKVTIVLCIIRYSKLEEPDDIGPRYKHAAVATDVGRCSTMSRDILLRGGSAVDAAITAALCVGVVNPQSSGIGGGFNMVVYNNRTTRAVALVAAETAPAVSSADMYSTRKSSKYGVKTIAVPGEVLGFWEAHKLFGKLPWADLFMPVIHMAETGFQVTPHLPYVVNQIKDNYAVIRNMYSREDGEIVETGDTLTAPVLATTLRQIALYGPNVFYTGSVAHDMLQDIKEAGGVVTPVDFATFKVIWRQVSSTTFKNKHTIYSAPLTASGPVLQYILNVLDEFNITNVDFRTDDQKLLLYHRFLESGKFAFALRCHLGDDSKSKTVSTILNALASKQFAKLTASLINDTYVAHPTRYGYDISESIPSEREQHSSEEENEITGDTAHLSVLAENGDAVSLTTSVGYYFGSKFYSQRTGVFLNNHMANFYFPAREASPIWKWPTANSIAPYRRYMTTVCPSVITDENGHVKMVVGASGGSRIIATNAWVILRTLWMGTSLKEAIDEKRIYNYLPSSNSAYYETGFPEELVDQLRQMGHVPKSNPSFAVSESILRCDDGQWEAYSDPRKGGDVDGY